MQKKLIPLIEEQQISENPREYRKLTFVFIAIFVVSIIANLLFDGRGPYEGLTALESFLSQFMGVFFIVFAMFKLVNLKSFIHGFMMYDVIAKQSRLYATIYPFLQLALGIGMFLIPSQHNIHLAAAVLSFVALIGVVNSLLSKKKFQCACLGNVIKMPLAVVSGIEDGAMLFISLYMYLAILLNFSL